MGDWAMDVEILNLYKKVEDEVDEKHKMFMLL